MSNVSSTDEPMPRVTFVQWLILLIAAIGFLFDIYEILMLPLIIRDAAMELGLSPEASVLSRLAVDWGIIAKNEVLLFWRAMMFFVPAFMGGLFGLAGGWLTDRVGRRRMLTFSIMLYAISAFIAGFSTSMEMLLIFRCTTFIGICLEFVAAVAWLSEVFPHPKQREIVLGWTQAFSSGGGLLVAAVFLLINALVVRDASGAVTSNPFPSIHMPEFLVGWLGEIKNETAVWRYTLMSGLIPALPLVIIRPFLPESPLWKQRKDAGTLRRPSYLHLFGPRFRRTTITATIITACGYGAAFGTLQATESVIPAIPQVQQKMSELPDAEAAAYERTTRGNLQVTQEIGGLSGRVLLAVLAVVILSRRSLIRVFQIPGLFIVPTLYAIVTFESLALFYVGIFLAGMLVVGQFSFWGNYLPRAYPLWLRGTGSAFAANVGGRMMGTACAALLSVVASLFQGGTATQFAYAAAAIAAGVFFLGFVMSFFLPEPLSEEELNE